MYFNLQRIFISVVTYRLSLIPIDVYIKKIIFFEVGNCLIYMNIQSNYIIHRVYYRVLISLLATDLKQSKFLLGFKSQISFLSFPCRSYILQHFRIKYPR